MKGRKPSTDAAQPDLFGEFKPVVSFKPVVIPQGNGRFLIEPGKPIVSTREAEIGTHEFARRSGLSQRHVNTLCIEGKIKARRKSPLKKSEYLIPETELARFLNITETEEN